jgi:hypothetical protein
MIYLSIKELAVSAEDVIMVTSSIMKDMQPNSEVIYRPNAIRALCRIIDVCSRVLCLHKFVFLIDVAFDGTRRRTLFQGCNC